MFLFGAAFVVGDAVCIFGGVIDIEFDCGSWKMAFVFACGED